ncbi:MAG: hypothetical protein GDA36_12090 [Rhodobacteraceae bacterium]|nr:hypothetical protein [Paracoccaceae bacterium]
MTDEAILRAAPRYDPDYGSVWGRAIADTALFALPAIAATPAGEHRHLLRMDGLRLMGFGPRGRQLVPRAGRYCGQVKP